MATSETPAHCGVPMTWYTVGAPGIGDGWWCEVCDHTVVVHRTRILRPEETR